MTKHVKTGTRGRRGGLFVLAVGLVAAFAAPAGASCLVKNETTFTFTVSSGNASNQQVNAHATTTIEAGKISGKSVEGRTISGACKDGGSLVIKEKNGVPLLLPRK
jgi:hypothetical protein